MLRKLKLPGSLGLRPVNLMRAASDLVMLQRHKAGEKLFVDWAGLIVGIVNPKTGKVKLASVFVAAIGASQYTFAKVYAHSSVYGQEWPKSRTRVACDHRGFQANLDDARLWAER
jgi:hypothetical protein